MYADHQHITYFAETNYRNTKRKFGIKDTDRLAHIYCIGKSGTGKSNLLQTLAVSDIHKGKGLAVIDPHGDVAQNLLQYIPIHRGKDVIIFNPADTEFPSAYNPLLDVPTEHFHLVASGLVATFKKQFSDSWGPRLEYVLRFCLLTLLHYGRGSLLDIQPLLTNPQYRYQVLATVHDGHIVNYWQNEFDKYSPSMRAEVISPILNKIGLFYTSQPLKACFGADHNDFTIQDVMDSGKIFIANLSKGNMGEDASTLMGSILVTAFANAALFRSRIPEQHRRPFFLYVDECHTFISHSFADILAECRKYGLSLFLAHQFIEQLDENIRAAVYGNVGTLICFRVGATDARYLAQEFHPYFNEEDLVNLPKYGMYLKMMIDGATSKPFSATTLPLPPVV